MKNEPCTTVLISLFVCLLVILQHDMYIVNSLKKKPNKQNKKTVSVSQA